MTTRKRRADGEASRSKILDAASEIAGERGYEGTSIGRVSARAGLPASSIYWYFADKDELIAAVIERSFADWIARAEASLPDGTPSRPETVAAGLRVVAESLLDAPGFLRLGLMLVLERRPEEPTARGLFLRVRDTARERMATFYRRVFTDLTDAQLQRLASFTMAAVDGLFIEHQVDRGQAGDGNTNLLDSFDVLAAAVLGAADHLAGDATAATGDEP